MIDLGTRRIDSHGQVWFSVDQLYSLLMKGFDISTLLVEESNKTEEFEQVCLDLDNPDLKITKYNAIVKPEDEYFGSMVDNWLIPEEYKSIDVAEFLIQKCSTQEQLDRVDQELQVYERYNLIPLLRSLIYVIDTFEKNKIVWGVGRGSSVSSYVLYLIRVHRIDSIRYNLDFSEFLS